MGWIGEGEKSVFHVGIQISDIPAGHHIGIPVNRIDRVGNKDGIILIEEIQNISHIAFGSIADKDVLRVYMYAKAFIIISDSFPQEEVSLLRAVAMKAF